MVTKHPGLFQHLQLVGQAKNNWCQTHKYNKPKHTVTAGAKHTNITSAKHTDTTGGMHTNANGDEHTNTTWAKHII